MDVKQALEMYEDQYPSGDLNASNYLECAQWLEGYMIGANLIGTPLERCIAILRGGGNLVDWLKRRP